MKKAKFNLIDILIVLCIIAAGFAGMRVLGGLKGTADGGSANGVKMRYSVEFAKKDKTVADAFSAAAERGDNCFVSEKEKAAAAIKEVLVNPAVKFTVDAKTGEGRWAEIPEKYDVTVILESDGTESDKDLLAEGKAVVKVGDEISVKGKGYAGYGFVTSLEIVE